MDCFVAALLAMTSCASIAHELVLPIPLRIKQCTQIRMIDARMGCCSDSGLGAIGDAEPCFAQHGKIVGAIAHCHCVMWLQAVALAQFDEGCELGFLAENGLGDEAGKTIVFDDQNIGAIFVKADGGCHFRCEEREAA